MDAAQDAARENADATSEIGSPSFARPQATTSGVVSFREKSTYRRDPEYSASGVRQYVNDQLYPHLLAAMQAINAHQPLHPVIFLARCLLEGSAPDDEPTAGARFDAQITVPANLIFVGRWLRRATAAAGGATSGPALLSDQVQGPLQDAITACVKEKPRPPDPVRAPQRSASCVPRIAQYM